MKPIQVKDQVNHANNERHVIKKSLAAALEHRGVNHTGFLSIIVKLLATHPKKSFPIVGENIDCVALYHAQHCSHGLAGVPAKVTLTKLSLFVPPY